MGLEPTTSRLEVWHAIQLRHAGIKKEIKKKLHRVGFEPTRLSPYDLKSYPLDHSGIHACDSIINYLVIR